MFWGCSGGGLPWFGILSEKNEFLVARFETFLERHIFGAQKRHARSFIRVESLRGRKYDHLKGVGLKDVVGNAGDVR